MKRIIKINRINEEEKRSKCNSPPPPNPSPNTSIQK